MSSTSFIRRNLSNSEPYYILKITLNSPPDIYCFGVSDAISSRLYKKGKWILTKLHHIPSNDDIYPEIISNRNPNFLIRSERNSNGELIYNVYFRLKTHFTITNELGIDLSINAFKNSYIHSLENRIFSQEGLLIFNYTEMEKLMENPTDINDEEISDDFYMIYITQSTAGSGIKLPKKLIPELLNLFKFSNLDNVD